jgi:hypothetical protein
MAKFKIDLNAMANHRPLAETHTLPDPGAAGQAGITNIAHILVHVHAGLERTQDRKNAELTWMEHGLPGEGRGEQTWLDSRTDADLETLLPLQRD